MVDEGDNYDSSNGVFTCKEDGVYAFAFGGHIASIFLSYNIYKNYAREYYGPYLSNPWPAVADSGTSSITRLVRCEAGDVITIQPDSSSDFLAHVTYLSAFALPSEGLIAFSAQLSSNLDIPNGFTVPFDVVPINEGNRFTPVHAAFGCLDNDFYVFTWSIATWSEYNQRPLSARLMMGSEEIKAGPQTMKPSNNSVPTSASTQVVVQCKNATSVYLEAVVQGSENQRIRNAYSDFSGFKLAPADD